ncbi:MAG: dicarboxylate/amino acid:cation symporter, partial [Longimicrobiales bacterium]
GWRTLLYYGTTTALAVMVGLVVVNVIRPGEGVSPGESHPARAYVVSGAASHTVTLPNDSWDRTGYSDKYVIVLSDQQVQGTVESMTGNTVTVRLWEKLGSDDAYYITADDGTRLPFRRVEGELVSSEPELRAEGMGVEITLPVTQEVRNVEGQTISEALRVVVLGDEEKQGLIPSNVFAAMARMEILPLIVFSIFVGAALSVLGPRVRTTIEVLSTLNDAVMRLVGWVMVIAPLGIFGLVAPRIGQAGGFVGFVPELMALGKYFAAVIIGLGIHGFVILPLILRLVGKRRPLAYAKGMGAALLNALSTSSSSATLPLTIQGVEQRNQVSNRTAGFVLPLGATINMDGTALYEAVAAMFIAQVYGISLSPAMQALIFLTATLAAIGAAGIPEAGLVTMVIVLRAVGLPIEGIALILAVDWLLDRFRTTVNVWGDSVGAGVIETLELRSEAAAET